MHTVEPIKSKKRIRPLCEFCKEKDATTLTDDNEQVCQSCYEFITNVMPDLRQYPLIVRKQSAMLLVN